MDNILFLVPAKGNSRRLPGKNMKLIDGEPMIWYALKRCLQVKTIGELDGGIYLSTEDNKIHNWLLQNPLSKNVYNINRPKELATDDCRMPDVALHAIEYSEKLEENYDTILITLPTSPLATYKHLLEAYELFKKDRKPVLSVTRHQGNPGLFMEFCVYSRLAPIDGIFDLIAHEYIGDKETWAREIKYGVASYLKANGAVFICDIEQFKKEKEWYIDGMKGYEMKPEDSVDVDTEIDFILAETLMRRKI